MVGIVPYIYPGFDCGSHLLSRAQRFNVLPAGGLLPPTPPRPLEAFRSWKHRLWRHIWTLAAGYQVKISKKVGLSESGRA